MDQASAIELVRGLVAIPSRSHEESEAAHWLVAQMRACGYDRAFVDAAGNAVGEIGSIDAQRTIVLLGHIDTVPGDIPVRIETTSAGEALYGRGSVDAKGPLATFVAAAARVGAQEAKAAGVRIVVVGAVEEEAATSKGARFIAARFNDTRERSPIACVIGEPSHWHRLTLGYKGRLLLDIAARQPMAHTAGPDASVAAVVVDMWNWATAHAARLNESRDKVFDQLSPSLRRFMTSTTTDMHDVVDAQIAWRLPLGFDVEAFVVELPAWAAGHVNAVCPPIDPLKAINSDPLVLSGARTAMEFRFRGYEPAWRADRQNPLVRSFLAAVRTVDDAVQPGFVLKSGTSDMNVVGPLWNCPIAAYGPGDSALDHTPDEHLMLAEYWRAILVMHGMLARLC
jgi:LysW-gamma-L-lysine carboxypeptidase